MDGLAVNVGKVDIADLGVSIAMTAQEIWGPGKKIPTPVVINLQKSNADQLSNEPFDINFTVSISNSFSVLISRLQFNEFSAIWQKIAEAVTK